MKGIYLEFYMYEKQRHKDKLCYEWLLEMAKKEGLSGGTVYRAIAGYGRTHKLHSEHFYELASDVPVKVTYMLTESEAAHFLKQLKAEKIDLFYIKMNAEFGDVCES